MPKPVQKRAIETRTRLITSAQELIAANGYEALRIEEIVLRAGVAKGTFFAHFKDKDALMDLLIGGKINAQLDELASRPAPQTITDLISALRPLCSFMTKERYVFDVIMRYSGATAVEEIGPIAKTFERQVMVLANWLAKAPFRKDISPFLMAEGVQAFMLQAMALKFCAVHATETFEERLHQYLTAWLTPASD